MFWFKCKQLLLDPFLSLSLSLQIFSHNIYTILVSLFLPGCSFVAVQEEAFSQQRKFLGMDYKHWWSWSRNWECPWQAQWAGNGFHLFGIKGGFPQFLGFDLSVSTLGNWGTLCPTNRIKSISRQVRRITGSLRLEKTSRPLSATSSCSWT